MLALAGAGLVAALATGRPELALIALPFLVFAGAGVVLAEEPAVSATVEPGRVRLLEGDNLGTTVRVRNDGRVPVEVEVALVRAKHLAVSPAGTVALRVDARSEAEIAFSVRPGRWGAHGLGPLTVRARDALGLTTWEGRLGERIDLRVFPREERLRELVAPLRTQPFLGSHVARARADGIEFADIRPFQAGDRARQVNWRASARRGSLQVNQRHPEHSSDVVLLIDTFEEARDQASGTLDAAVRAAAMLARAHLGRRDRVGVVDFGGTLHWLEPAFGTTQLYRIVDALLSSDIAFSYAWRKVDSLPQKVLPPGALTLAITPLLDERSIALVSELRTRGFDLTVIEISPLDHISRGPTAADAVAYELWRLEREALRARLRALGIGVAVWESGGSLGPTLEEVNAFRRSARAVLRA
ncbi:MAG TPA: DUF58 domain-containing protein [Solirubrobacteraceae bacterium]|nr:DUF58 domain-containing protein [Solirubrobacteraceae bacterium]